MAVSPRMNEANSAKINRAIRLVKFLGIGGRGKQEEYPESFSQFLELRNIKNCGALIPQ
jgi:hypothetical protein